MPSVSSLLKSAAATRKKVAEQQDAQVAFDWSLSAKTAADFQAYQEYWNSRREVYADDPSKLLTIDKTIVAARKAYVSNEIQRRNIDIIEGRGTAADKYEAMKDLFFMAVDNGDYDLAQTLNLQLDNLSVKMQQEQIAEQDRAYRATQAAAQSADNSLKKTIDALFGSADYVTTPDGSEYPSLKQISRQIQDNGTFKLPDGSEISPFYAATETLNAIRQLTIARWENAPDQDTRDALESKYGIGLERLDTDLTANIGGMKLTGEDLITAYENEKINNPVYSLKYEVNPTTGIREYKLKENKVDRFDVIRQIDPNTGEEKYVAAGIRTSKDKLTFGDGTPRDLGTEITNEGFIIGQGKDKGQISAGEQTVARDGAQNIEQRLNSLGYQVRQQDGKIYISGRDLPETPATIQPDGSIRYFDQQGQLIEVGVVDRQLGMNDNPDTYFKAGVPRVVSPEEISDFAQASEFGTGMISQRSARGENYLANYRGERQFSAPSVNLEQGGPVSIGGRPMLSGKISVGNNFSGLGGALTTGLLQGAQSTRDRIAQEELQKQQMLQLQAQRDAQVKLQQAQVFNLNQTPVSQLTSGGILKSQLKVAPAPPAPRVTVAPMTQAPKISSVSVAKPTGAVGVQGSGYITIPGLSF